MKAADEVKRAENRERSLRTDLERGRKEHGRRVPPQPARDDRGPEKSWRPGER